MLLPSGHAITSNDQQQPPSLGNGSINASNNIDYGIITDTTTTSNNIPTSLIQTNNIVATSTPIGSVASGILATTVTTSNNIINNGQLYMTTGILPTTNLNAIANINYIDSDIVVTKPPAGTVVGTGIVAIAAATTAITTPSTTAVITNSVNTIQAVKTATAATNTYNVDLTKHLDVLQDALKDGWTVHCGKEGRLYYCNHITHSAGWLPPCENWGPNEELPYGWEKAIDAKGRSYFINHLNKTSTYEAPDYSRWNDETPPEPRTVTLYRSPTMGFGFVAGSERPVIVRFVTEGGPSVNKLQPGDQILAVNDEDVKEAQRDHVIQLVRSCETQVKLLVCQPARTIAGPGRKSTLLSAGKRAKLRTRPSRVRFAESVCVNGAPLFPPSAFSLGDLCVPPMANVLKVFLENGQTKSFKYDATTTVHDVVTSLRDKLCLTASEHFSLVLEHVKSLKRNKLTLLDPDETLARIAARPGAHKLRCLFRVTFVPVSAAELAQKDLNALDYLYMQCCNDVTQERFAPELQPEVALRLAALHIHQHALANNVSPAKLTVKIVEREFGLERFVPSSLVEGMKRKELRRLISHFLKLNSQMTGSSSKMLTQLQAKIHYLDIISGLPSYGAKCFSTSQREGMERVLLISPRFGLSQIAGVRNSVPQPICTIEELLRVVVHREDDITCTVHVQMAEDRMIKFSMEDRDACEFSLVLAGYYKLLTGGKDLHVDREREKYEDDNAPAYLSQHTVFPAKWSYVLPFHNRAHNVSFLVPPPYHSLQEISATKDESIISSMINHCDRNMNTAKIPNNNHQQELQQQQNNLLPKIDIGTSTINNSAHIIPTNPSQFSAVENRMLISDDFGLDLHSVMAMELLEEAAKDCTSGGGGSSSASSSTNSYSMSSRTTNGYVEAKNEEVLRRVQEMQKMVESSEQYLNEHGELIHEYEIKNSSLRQPWNSTSLELDSDCESLNSSKVSSNEDAPPPGALKHSDSLILLAEAINQDLTGITKGLNSIGGLGSNNTNTTNSNGGANNDFTNTNNNNKNKLNSQINNGSANPQSPKVTPKPTRKINGLSQLLSELQSLGNDCSQSESDSESVHTPSQSPTIIKRNVAFGPTTPNQQQNGGHKKMNQIRTSFGLHSPDSSVLDSKDSNLRDYLRQLKEFSKADVKEMDHTDLAAKKLSELYGFDISEDTFIETDPDLIDLRAIPPPQTPDELDSAFTILNNAPKGFGDAGNKSEDEGDLDQFLAKVIVAPPTQKATPAKELTPEEIMSFIIPPPPNLEELEKRKSLELNLNNGSPEFLVKTKNSQVVSDKNINNSYYSNYNQNKYSKESLYSNSNNINSNQIINGQTNNIKALKENGNSNHVIEYSTVERKGAFSCCTKSKKEEEQLQTPSDSSTSTSNCSSSTDYPGSKTNSDQNDDSKFSLPPRRCPHQTNYSPPARPPKNTDLHSKISNSPVKRITFSPDLKRIEPIISQTPPPIIPPRIDGGFASPPSSSSASPTMSPLGIPPKKPPLPPIAVKPILRNPQPLPKPNLANISSPIKIVGIGSPHLHRNLSAYRDHCTSPTSSSPTTSLSSMSPTPQPRSNGHHRSNSDCPPVCLKNPSSDNKPQLSLLCSPQMSRKLQSNENNNLCASGVTEQYQTSTITRNGYVVNGEALLAKTDIAMAGLLVRLDHVAAQCTAAQSAGGGANIDEQKFEKAREELTEQTLNLVTASKLLVVAMSDPSLSSLPEHLTSCLTAIRRITELTQDMTRHTSSPLQTRNIVLKVHDVASSFRELAGVQIGLLGAGQLALQAECLAGVLTTLLRSLRVFSP
ncbi:uncharacterized protein LOC129608184 [Condylostylus longicornis]|uniref:uncharacterized protein LOC129608184 n=1 Tax=Condylostylus longicornis TaxID=2530218 RepID=UPI00244E57E9|nr:uncharacterized protein LOC129608184 [Condylostylus longicornis]